ncbi:hypothetical protein [Haloglycomyces albus]|uniref:hypothetical protein n=1 Tax=Haloglycomyces albus TaxID=526067 RepID=UPI00046C9CB1|nr:hypothetical protein [Haloglycomyces albus]
MPYLLPVSDDTYKQHLAFDVESFPRADTPVGQDIALAGSDGVYALGRGATGAVEFTRRIDPPVCLPIKGEEGRWQELSDEQWQQLTVNLAPETSRRDWIVNLSVPIEASDPAEAARRFWSYVQQLGPTELPLFVAPYGEEIQGEAYLLGQPHEQDPEDE